MFCVCEKLKMLQKDLKQLNTKDFNDLSSRVASSKQQLDDIQSALGANPSDVANQATEKVLCKQYLTLARAEESFARQKI